MSSRFAFGSTAASGTATLLGCRARSRAAKSLLLLALLTACGGERATSDATTADRSRATAAASSDAAITNIGTVGTVFTPRDGAIADKPDASAVGPIDAGAMDAALAAEAGPLPITCQTADSGISCDDGRFCTGVELCSPADPGADARGCVVGQGLSCAAGETCSESMQRCSTCSDTALDDHDGDGHEAASCGGDDCRDDDPAIHPAGSEVCDGKDNDCDGKIDGAAADSACMELAPPNGTSSCAARGCRLVCNDPDFDARAGACTRHDDCAGVTACAAGTCVDGVRSYSCTCPSGYAGSGSTACTDIDECASAAANPCDSLPPACINDPGSFHCQCPDTHHGDAQGARGCVRKALQVAAGAKRTCALLQGGAVRCWGSDQFGALGTGATAETPRGGAPGTMGDALISVNLGPGRTAVQVAVGTDLVCSALDDGSAKCWGYAGYGALGGPPSSGGGISNTVAPLPSGRRAKQVSAGSGYGFALLDDGSIGSWGGSFARYGFVAGERFTSFDRSPRYDAYHVCAVLESGAVRCWPGNASYTDPNQYGPLGWAYSGSLAPAAYPLTQLGSGHTATAVATGESHSCALLDDASVKCWGRNDHGQLGVGDTVARGLRAADMGDALPIVPLGAPVRAIAAGANHTCALLDGGQIKCWGLNDLGQLGQGSTADLGDQSGEVLALLPVDLGPGRTGVAIDVGSHTCALLDDGGLKCWGGNASGELGQEDTLTRGDTPGSMGAALKEIDVGS